MDELLSIAEQVGKLLVERRETIAVAESSAGGLISAALLAVAGASAYFVGGAVVYTRTSRTTLLAIAQTDLEGIRPSTEAYALLLSGAVRERLGTTWGIGETGATGPTGNRYGDAAGHACLGVSGPLPSTRLARTVETGGADRYKNMQIFATTALKLFHEAATRVD